MQAARTQGRGRAAELVHHADGRVPHRAWPAAGRLGRDPRGRAGARTRWSCRGAAPQGGIAAARAGHDVVMAPGSHTYFDHYQSLDRRRSRSRSAASCRSTRCTRTSPCRPSSSPSSRATSSARRVRSGPSTSRGRRASSTWRSRAWRRWPRCCGRAPDAEELASGLSGRLSRHLERLRALDVAYRPPGPCRESETGNGNREHGTG